jgi:hypothetical protein
MRRVPRTHNGTFLGTYGLRSAGAVSALSAGHRWRAGGWRGRGGRAACSMGVRQVKYVELWSSLYSYIPCQCNIFDFLPLSGIQ